MLAEIKGKLAALESAEIKDPDYNAKGFHLDVKVDPEKVVDAAQVLDEAGFFIEAVTGVDMLTFPFAVPVFSTTIFVKFVPKIVMIITRREGFFVVYKSFCLAMEIFI